jgi:hypothetical protein
MKAAACLLLSMGAAALSPVEIRIGESVEWLVYDSDIIASGTVLGAKIVDGPRGAKFAEVTLKISESFKGKVGAEITFQTNDQIWQRIPARCRDSQVEMLLFLVESKRYEEYYGGILGSPWALRLAGETVTVALDDRPAMGLFDVDFREHLKKGDIVKATRRAVSAMQKEMPRSLRVEAQWDSAVERRLFSGSTVYLVVPLDAAAEKKAKAWLHDSNIQPRVDGVRVLEHFKSPDNIQLLKPLLDDAACQTVTEPGAEVKGLYPVRREAYRVLTAWMSDVKNPVLETLGDR